MKRPGNRTLGLGVGAVLVLALAATLVVALLPEKGSTPPKATATPTVNSQLAWIVGATHHLPLTDAELHEHFVPGYFQGLSTQTFEGILVNLGPLTLAADPPAAEASDSVSAVASSVDSTGTATKYGVSLSVSHTGLIDSVRWTPLLSQPKTWPAVDKRLRALAPRVSFASERIDRHGACALVHGFHADTPRPLASAFKLYVLGALAHSVAIHHARWDQTLAIRNAWKTIGSGVLQKRPAGTKLTLRAFADKMVSISDNTAADHLIHLLGRTAVQRQLHRFGNTHARLTTPFPTTRQVFVLKGDHYPRLANRFLAAPRAVRARILDRTAEVRLSTLRFSIEPRDVGSIEWFASPDDICRAFSGLLRQNRNPGLRPVGAALSINEGGLFLNAHQYPVTWFKGGSEQGVLTLNYLVKSTSGSVLVNSVMLSDPRRPLDDRTVSAAQAIVRGAVALDHAR
jgi:hypothetical protein